MDKGGQGWGILLLAGALVLALKAKGAKAGAALPTPPPAGAAPPTAEPAVEILEAVFQGSPQSITITKRQGEAFTAFIPLRNPTAAEWTYEVSLRFGELAFWPAWTTEPTMPILMGTITVPAGETRTLAIPHRVPDNAKPKTYDYRVEVQVDGKGIEGGIDDKDNRFTVLPKEVAPEVSLLEVTWI